MPDLPVSYEFPSWREPPGHMSFVNVEPVLKFMAANHPGWEDELDERAVRNFAAACSFPLVDLDIEDSVPFPHFRFASRKWVREKHQAFVSWCKEVGYLPAAGETVVEKPKKVSKKPKKVVPEVATA